MSKPETPCDKPGCVPSFGLHDIGCVNGPAEDAPKAEAPPANGNEPYEEAFRVLEPALGLSCEDPACGRVRDHKGAHMLKAANVSEPLLCSHGHLRRSCETCEVADSANEAIERLRKRHDDKAALVLALTAERDALKAQNAALTAELERLRGENQSQAEELASSGRVRSNGEVWKLETLLKEHRVALEKAEAERDKFEAESEQKGADLMACEGTLEEVRAENAELRSIALSNGLAAVDINSKLTHAEAENAELRSKVERYEEIILDQACLSAPDHVCVCGSGCVDALAILAARKEEGR